ncbi:hypothetical protein [Paenibacillus lutrae]|uniref:Uncharacterized protein n=1 Tax=Paenibacillus lutrae TaxID=2078573 RepID=A0A7X3K1C0_9BACL|nr:hypothetical protein [Paenibacillus lutrae]MVP02078.1 hypothetical protein [Paenibacillus lutrae]
MNKIKHELFNVEERAALETALEDLITMASMRILRGDAYSTDKERIRGAKSVLSRLNPDSVYLKHAQYYKEAETK